MLSAWGAVAAKLKAGEITKEEYDRWRYRYPELDTSGQWHKITPSQDTEQSAPCRPQRT